MRSSGEVDPDEVRRRVDDVLSRPEFADAEPGLLARVRDWLSDQLGQLLENLLGAGPARLAGSIVLVAAAVVAVLLGWWFARGIRRDPEAAAAVEGPVGRAAEDWLADAETHERHGRLRDAVRCRYRGLVAELAAAGLIDEVAGRTAGEYLDAVRARVPDAAEPFAAVTRVFETAWYSGEPVAPGDVHGLRRHAAAVRDAVGGRADRRIAAAGRR